MAKKAAKKTVKKLKSHFVKPKAVSPRKAPQVKPELDATVHAKEEEDLYPDEEQGILPEETSEEHELAMALGDEDEDIYTEEGRKKLQEDDEIEPWEEGLIEGATELGQLGKDALTGQPLMGADEVIEMELNGKMYRFVSTKNAEKFRKKMMKGKK